MLTRGRSQRWVLLFAVLALLAAACGGSDSADEAGGASSEEAAGDGTEAAAAGGEGGEFSYFITEPEHLFPPSNVTESEGNAVLTALYSPLVDLDLETSDAVWGDEAPNAVAADVTSDDQQTWTITLKEGWTFHDGSPVTAQSYVDTWNAGAAAVENTGNRFFDSIEGYDEVSGTSEGSSEPTADEMSGLSVVDDQTFEVTLKQPFSQFPLVINYTAFFPLPQSCLDDPDSCTEAPIGNGPFQMEGEWERNQNVTLTRYPDFAGGNQPSVETINFPIYADLNTAFTDLQAGNLDVMDTVPPEQLTNVEQEFGDRFITGESSVFTFIGFPTYDEAFADPQLRTAFSMAVDRQAIIDAIRIGDAPADAFVSPVVAGYREGTCSENCSYNPEMAKQLFDEAGGYDGTLTLWLNSGGGHEEWMEAVANQLRENLGIENIEFESLDFAQYLPKLDNEEVTGPFRLGWAMDYPSMQNYLEPLLSTNGSSANTGWSNEEFDDLIAQGNAASSVAEGVEFYQQAEDIAVEEMPLMPMFFDQLQAVHSERVTNVQFNAQENLDYTAIEVTE